MRELLRCGLFSILAAEAFNTASRIHQTLFAGEERVAVGADFHADPAFVCGARFKRVAARTMNLNGSVIGMNTLFGHGD